MFNKNTEKIIENIIQPIWKTENKQEPEFDWKEIIVGIFECFGDITPQCEIEEAIKIIETHCVPKEDYETARIVAEEVHNELLCAQEKLEKVREWIKKEDSYNVESPNFEELNQILNQPNQ